MTDHKRISKMPITLSFLLFLLSFTLLFLGFTASHKFDTIDDSSGSTISQYIGLSVAAWHQEIEIYFTGKLLEKNGSSKGLGLVEPTLRGEFKFAGKFPLKFNPDLSNFNISYRPYLSSPGLLTDTALLLFKAGTLIGVSSWFLLFLLYGLNLLFNIFFIYLLLFFISEHVSRKRGLIATVFLVFSPWIILDSLSIMWSPVVRFGGIFLLLFCWWHKKIQLSSKLTFWLITFGLVISSFNGFEFFFFQLAILLMPMSVLFYKDQYLVTLKRWAKVSLTATTTSFFIWYLVVLVNVGNFYEAGKVLFFTFFKHSLFRSGTAPIEAVASGDSHLPIFSGLIKLLTGMSVLLPYPFPESLMAILGISLPFLVFIQHITSFVPIAALLLIFARQHTVKFTLSISLLFFCLTAIATNSYVFNHPHHMPPVLLFYLIFYSVIQFKPLRVL